MKLDDLINHTCEWLKGTGPNSDIVMSSRVRLARNLSKLPFPHRANKKQSEDVLVKVKEAIQTCDYCKKSFFFELADLDSVDKQFLIERHLMSREHAAKSDHKAIVISEEEIVAIMVNEEDHLRIQVMQSGFNLFEAWQIINNIDNELSSKLDFAFLPDWGYLTACPTNTGTGLRGSVMLHLPALVMTKQINKLLQVINKLSFNARGLYGEGTQALGNFFQISNQVALGHNEDELVDNIHGVIRQLIEQETQARNIMMTSHKELLIDRISRSFGTLKTAHIISSDETVELLSMVRLGIDLGVIKDIERSLINELFILIQPAHLQKLEGKKLSTQERDFKRASIIREKLTNK
ncbi:MAG: protein arginine kinase [Candidatus Omnitrophota bacterium]